MQQKLWIVPKTYLMKPGRSLLLGGLARIDFTEVEISFVIFITYFNLYHLNYHRHSLLSFIQSFIFISILKSFIVIEIFEAWQTLDSILHFKRCMSQYIPQNVCLSQLFYCKSLVFIFKSAGIFLVKLEIIAYKIFLF